MHLSSSPSRGLSLPSLSAALMLALAGGVTLAGQGAAAQDWTYQIYEDPGRYRSAQLVRHDERLAFYCGEVLSDETGLWEELIFTAPGHVNLVVSEVLMGPYGLDVPDPQTVSAFGMGREIATPPFYFDVMGGTGWFADLPVGHDIISAAAGGADVVLKPEQGARTFSIYGSGLSQGMTRLLDYCAAGSGAGGETDAAATAPAQPAAPASGDGTTPPDGVDPELAARAQDLFRAKCAGGDFTVGPEDYRMLDVTGDGQEELLLSYNTLTCTSGLFAAKPPPVCVGEMCRTDILTRENPDPLILYSVTLRPAPDRPGDILLGLDEASCVSMDLEAGCVARMRWVSNTFGTIGME